jgi:hypothetical protein
VLVYISKQLVRNSISVVVRKLLDRGFYIIRESLDLVILSDDALSTKA